MVGTEPGNLTAAADQERLRESEERLRLLVEGVQDYAIFMLDPEGTVVSWNSGAERLKGYRSEEICGQHFSRFYVAEDLRAGKPAEVLRTATAAGRAEDEGWRVRKDGTLFWASVSITALRDPDGRLRGFAKVTREFTERNRALVDEERGRIARDLHDSVSQALFSITLQARGLELALEAAGHDPTGSLGARAASIRTLTEGALAEMRALIFELRPAALAADGLIAALRKHAVALAASEGLVVNISATADHVPLEPAIEENLHRLVQEALSNVVRHAQASTLHVRLAWDETAPAAGIELEVIDDGIGFDTGVGRPGHLGLTSMSERAARLGATLQVISAPGRGTTVRATVPMRGPDPLTATTARPGTRDK